MRPSSTRSAFGPRRPESETRRTSKRSRRRRKGWGRSPPLGRSRRLLPKQAPNRAQRPLPPQQYPRILPARHQTPPSQTGQRLRRILQPLTRRPPVGNWMTVWGSSGAAPSRCTRKASPVQATTAPRTLRLASMRSNRHQLRSWSRTSRRTTCGTGWPSATRGPRPVRRRGRRRWRPSAPSATCSTRTPGAWPTR